MVGGIKASSPGVKSMSAGIVLDFCILLTMSATSGEERKLAGGIRTGRARWAMPPPRASAAGRTAGYTVRAPLKRRRLNPQG
jgi:hypothetical protein